MTTTNGWPGKPGVPLNPERDGIHKLGKYFVIWRAETQDYVNHNGNVLPPEVACAWPYRGPCLTPEEIARLRAEVATARWQGMEEAAKIADSCAADWAKSAIGKYINSKWDFQSRAEAGEEIAAAIRAAAKEGKP